MLYSIKKEAGHETQKDKNTNKKTISPFLSFHFTKLFLIKLANLNFHSTAKFSSRKNF